MYGHTRKDRIRNKDIQDKVGMTSVEDKMREWDWDGSGVWRKDAQMSQCEGVRGWLWMIEKEVQMDQRNIRERWLNKTWAIIAYWRYDFR